MTPINCSLSLHGNTHSVLSIVQLGCLKISVVRKHSAKFSAVRRPGWTSRGDSLHWGLTGKGCVGTYPALPHLLKEESHTHTLVHACQNLHKYTSVAQLKQSSSSETAHVNTNTQILNGRQKFLRGTFWNPKQIFLCVLFTSLCGLRCIFWSVNVKWRLSII